MKRLSTTSRTRPALAILLLWAAATAGCSATSSEDRLDPLGLIPPPPTIAASEAGEHVGELVVVRTKIASARVERGQAVLEPEGDDPGGFVIAIAPPVVGPTARELATKYEGQEVRAVGYISDLGNDLELLIGDPGRIRLADAEDERDTAAVAAAPAEPDRPEPGAPPAAEPVAPARVPAPVAAAPVAAAPAPAAAAARSPTPEPSPKGPDPACENARRAWKIAAADAKAPLAELLGCLDDGEPRCKDAAARARVALAEVAASEERLRWVCGGGS